MLDFWGKNRATLYAAEESATVARYNREVVTLTTIVTDPNSGNESALTVPLTLKT